MDSQQSPKNPLTVKFKKLVVHAQEEQDLVPATSGSAGIDLVATDLAFNHEFGYYEYGTGLSIEIPEGYEGQIRPRSSISKKSLMICNTPGTIDSDYRGEILVRFKVIDEHENYYLVGDKIAQLVIAPVTQVKFVEVKELSDTKRGSGGFGSTGV